MRVEKIVLSGFRNYEEEAVEFGTDVNIISGSNAQGKTNLLEAIYILTGDHSFRARSDRELIGFYHDWAEISADICSNSRKQFVHLMLRKNQQRSILVNGAKKNSADLSGIVTAVLFSPDDLYLIKEGSAVRRRLMNQAIGQLRPRYAVLMAEYNKLYKNKTRILRDWREKPSLLNTLDDFSDSLAKCSARIIRYRASFVERLNQSAVPIHLDFSSGRENLQLIYTTVSTVTNSLASVEEIYSQICRHQKQHRQAEINAGHCLTGIHKDDILICINGNPARTYASQGQIRSASVSIKLGEREIFQEETGEYPILLLDDVLSELDESRQKFILNRIQGGQTLITCCEKDEVSRLTSGHVFTVQAGHIFSSVK